jgi:hypothetical protein
MSQSILGGDVTVFFLDENRQKRLSWTGSASGTRTVNELYSALEDLFDEPLQSDDGSPMSAETPVEYTIGIIDAGDLDPWYMSYDLAEHLTGGAIRTASWARVQDVNAGIIVVPVTSNTIVAGDVGLDISGATTGAGTLLEVIEAGSTDYLVIRPNSSAAGDNFTTASQTITCNAHTATQSGAVSFTGEQIWANLYNVTPIDADTHVYLYQGLVSDATRARIARISGAAGDWWAEGAFDRLYYIKNFKATSNPIVDGGFITVFARKGNTLYDSFEVATSTVSGGRNPVPLKAAVDLNHTTGYKSITTTAVGTDDFAVGDEILGGTSGARGIITLITGANPTYTFHYYLIGDPQVDFQTAAETVTDVDATGSATKDGNAPADQGPALQSWFTANAFPTITHAFAAVDIDNDGNTEGYGITIDCNANPLTEVYEWLQHILRNGGVTTTNSDGIRGEQYQGPTVYLEYSGAVTGSIAEGSDVTQETSGATGIVVSHDATKKQILLRDTRGTFVTHASTATLTDNDTTGTVEIDVAAVGFAANTAAPFGSFAGGRFFGARGVVLSDWLAADENSFQLVTSNGLVTQRPTAITLEVTNLIGGAESAVDSDIVSLMRLLGSGLAIDKTEYSAAGGEAIGDATLVVDSAITADTPGKTTGGVLRIRDFSDNNKEYRIRYSSWSVSTFTLANIVIAAADGGTDTNTIVEAGAFATAKRGDIVVNHTRAEAVSYVTQVVDANTVEISPAIAGQTTGDSIELNCVPVAINTADDVFVPLMDRYATAAAESVSIVFVASIFYRAKVTNKRHATKIKPFVTNDSTAGTNRSIAAIRNTDTIAA